MSKPAVNHIPVIKYNNGTQTSTVDLLAVEEPLEIRLGYGPKNNRQQINIAVTMRTPGNDFELATGFLFTEGIIKSLNEIYSIKYCTDLNQTEQHYNTVRVELNDWVVFDPKSVNRNFYATSSCGVCGKASIEAIHMQCQPVISNTFKVPASLILQLPDLLNEEQAIFKHTGGLHACALFSLHAELLLLREDIGRHNALDKLIGASIGSSQININQCMLLLSGRAGFEMIQKAAMAGIGMVCAIGAPSSLAAQLAKDMNITLIGFLKKQTFNIYTHAERIL